MTKLKATPMKMMGDHVDGDPGLHISFGVFEKHARTKKYLVAASSVLHCCVVGRRERDAASMACTKAFSKYRRT
ncbi:hypothetical protein [Neorhodopirellula lusitana]|nr:hypothetical protein [Neorhodopirellula lusitana]